jgi:hypothetical protein
MSENEKLGNFALSLAEDVKKLNEQISTFKEALLPFSKMHRPGCDLDELACQRGVASDKTVLFSEDFRNASLPGVLAGCAEREKARKESQVI